MLSQQIEDLLVARNLRGMQFVQQLLSPGYYLRAAELVLQACQNKAVVLIGTGFPIRHSFETDGPLGAMVLYSVLEKLGGKPIIVCGQPLAAKLGQDFRVKAILVGNLAQAEQEAQEILSELSPQLLISIEHPGLSRQGLYFNMRGEDISSRCTSFDFFLLNADCPSIGIGDGGNEIGMGNVEAELACLNIIPSTTCCNELLVADVSNWASYGIMALLGIKCQQDLLADIQVEDLLRYLSERGGLDGVTAEPSLTEDSLGASVAQSLIEQIRQCTGFL